MLEMSELEGMNSSTSSICWAFKTDAIQGLYVKTPKYKYFGFSAVYAFQPQTSIYWGWLE